MRSLLTAISLLCIVLALSAVASVPAMAQSTGCGTNALPGEAAVPAYCDQGIAYAGCMAAQETAASAMQAKYPDQTVERWNCPVDGSYYFRCYVRIAGVTESQCSARNWTFKIAGTCAARNAEPLADAAPWYSEPSTCIGGCKVQGQSFTGTSGGVKTYGMRSRTYTGETCAPSRPSDGIAPPDPSQEKEDEKQPKPDECTALGNGQTGCQKPDGDYCATASTGKTFCWKPGEQGDKSDGNDSQNKQPKGLPVKPPTTPPPPNTEYQRSDGHQYEYCSAGKCTTYNITNFNTTAPGTSKNGTGDNSVDGSVNKSGNGATSGNGSGGDSGSKDSATDSGNCTAAPQCTGDTLKCLHLRFTWKVQCHTKKNEVSNGTGCTDADVPVCAGDSCKAEAYSQLLQQWRARCATESVIKGIEGQAGQGDGSDGDGSIIIDDSGETPSLNEGKVAYAGGQLGYSFDVQGVSFEIPQQILDFLPILRFLIIACASIAAIHIMRGN